MSKFWINQPIIITGNGNDGLINTNIFNKTEPYKLPEGYRWCNLDLTELTQLSELSEFLKNHYVENDGSNFRLGYSTDILRFALLTPNYIKDLHIGIRSMNNNKLLAFISGSPCNVNIRGNIVSSCDVNFLCIHKKLRNKRLAPVLIKELTRRGFNKYNIKTAIYTSGTEFAPTITKAVYYHKYINIKKLIDYNFLPKKFINKNDLLDNSFNWSDLGLDFCKLECNNPIYLSQIKNMYERYFSKFHLYKILSENEISHFFKNIDNSVYIYILKNKDEILCVGGFYKVDLITKNKTDIPLQLGFLWYTFSKKNVTASCFRKFINQIINCAEKEGIDFLSTTNTHIHQNYLNQTGFVRTNNPLYFYFANWKTEYIKEINQGFMVI